MMNRSKSKPEVELQYGRRPFSWTRSSSNSGVNWDISSKFGVQIDFDVPKRVSSLKLKLEVDFPHFEKSDMSS